MAYTPEKLTARLIAEGNKTEKFFRDLPSGAWERQIYADGEHWQVRQVLSHLAQAEDAMLRLMKSIREGSEGVPEGFDLDAYNERKVKEIDSFAEKDVLQVFIEARGRTIEWVAGLSPDDLQREGRHPFLGVAALEEIIKLMYRHAQIHQRDIRKLLVAGDR